MISWLWDWLIGGLQDDFFKPATFEINLESANVGWNGSTTSPRQEVILSGHGGQYHIIFDWQLVKVDVSAVTTNPLDPQLAFPKVWWKDAEVVQPTPRPTPQPTPVATPAPTQTVRQVFLPVVRTAKHN